MTWNRFKIGAVVLMVVLGALFLFVPRMREWAMAGMMTTMGAAGGAQVVEARRDQNATLTELFDETEMANFRVDSLEDERDIDLMFGEEPVTDEPTTEFERERRRRELEADKWNSGRW